MSKTIAGNLDCLEKILTFNVHHGLLFFRITSDLVPFASHPVCTFPWREEFAGEFETIGAYIRKHGFRISMHPDQFVLLNATDKRVLERSIADLNYQTQVLDLMGLDPSAKVQVHVGGIYGDKQAAIERFLKQYDLLDSAIQERLVIENDERLYSLHDCLAIHEQSGIPVIADTFHHSLLNNGESFPSLLTPMRKTWKDKDGIPMIDYSSQEPGRRYGAHAMHIVEEDFRQFIKETMHEDFDIMLEIKDKEKSARAALDIVRNDSRLITGSLGDA
jgi:UV DNA damage endonuclease